MSALEPYIKKWYDSLRAGQILGVRCNRCGAYEFPPVPVCNTCSATDVEWAPISGNAELYSFAYSEMGVAPYTDEPVMCGYFKLAEGPELISWLMNADESRDAQEALLARLPVAVRAEIREMDENISWPVFRLVE